MLTNRTSRTKKRVTESWTGAAMRHPLSTLALALPISQFEEKKPRSTTESKNSPPSESDEDVTNQLAEVKPLPLAVEPDKVIELYLILSNFIIFLNKGF